MRFTSLWILSTLSVCYLIIIIVNVAFQLKDAGNGLIESSGTFGYIVTYALSLLMACGFFVGSTVVQLIVYRVKKKSVSDSLTVLIIFEVIKIAGNSVYIYLIDYANIHYGGAVTAFIISGMVIFAVISVLEIVLLVLMKISEQAALNEKAENR